MRLKCLSRDWRRSRAMCPMGVKVRLGAASRGCCQCVGAVSAMGVDSWILG